jgi:RNA polymerase sigma-70 factor, ECF subfamily
MRMALSLQATLQPSEDAPEYEPEDELVRAAQTDLTAFAKLYRHYLGTVYRYLRSRTSSDEDAADLTQQVFLQAFSALPGYEQRGLPFAAWLFRIARNAALNAKQRSRDNTYWDLMPETLQMAGPSDLEAEVIQQEAVEKLRTVLMELAPDRRELIVLRFVAELSVHEIANVLGKNEPAIYKQLTRTLDALKRRYKEAENGR